MLRRIKQTLSGWLKSLGHFLRLLVSGVDNYTPDIVRVLSIPAGMIFIFLAVWSVCANKQPFNGIEFGTGWGLFISGACAGIAIKRKTEPGHDVVPPAHQEVPPTTQTKV